MVERELNRDLPLEDVHEDLELLLVCIDVDDLAVEVGERARGYLHRLAERELDLRARSFPVAAAGVEDPVDLVLGQRDGFCAGADARARTTVEFSLGESVKVTSGPLSDFDGEIVDVNPDQQKLKVLVDIFERQVPVELGFDQVKKLD